MVPGVTRVGWGGGPAIVPGAPFAVARGVPPRRPPPLGPRARAAAAGLALLACGPAGFAQGTAPGVESGSTTSAAAVAATTATTSAGPSAVATEPSLAELREQARREADSGGPGASPALARWELLARVLRPVDPPAGPDLTGLRGQLEEARARVAALEEAPREAPVDPGRLQALSVQLSRTRDLLAEWGLHQNTLETELDAMRSELRLVEAGQGAARAGLAPALRRRALNEGVHRFERRVAEASEGVGLLEGLLAVQGQEYKGLRLREAAGEKDLKRKEEELAVLEAATRKHGERAAALLREAVAAEEAATAAQERLESDLRGQPTEIGQRTVRLKADRELERKELALERGALARTEQELAEARAAAKRAEIRLLGERRRLAEGETSLDQLRNTLEEAEGEVANLEAQYRDQQRRLERARGLLDRLRAIRRGYRQREEDLLAPDLPQDKKGAAWVLRNILSVLDEREQVAEEVRDRRGSMLEVLEFRRRDQDAWVDSLRDALPDEFGDLLEGPTRPRFAHVASFVTDLVAGARQGVPLQLLRLLGARAVAALEGRTVAPLGSTLLLALLVYLLLAGLLRLVEGARTQAVMQAEAFEAARARRLREAEAEARAPPSEPPLRSEPGRRPEGGGSLS